MHGAEGNGTPEGDQEVLPRWTEESYDLLEVTIIDKASSGFGTTVVELEHEESVLCGYLGKYILFWLMPQRWRCCHYFVKPTVGFILMEDNQALKYLSDAMARFVEIQKNQLMGSGSDSLMSGMVTRVSR